MVGVELPYSKEIERAVDEITVKWGEDVTIILYGSIARREYGEWSDIDLVIISEKARGTPIERMKMLSDITKEKIPLEAIIYTPQEFLKAIDSQSITALDAIEEGIVLHDKGFLEKARERFEKAKKEKKLVKRNRDWVSLEQLKECITDNQPAA